MEYLKKSVKNLKKIFKNFYIFFKFTQVFLFFILINYIIFIKLKIYFSEKNLITICRIIKKGKKKKYLFPNVKKMN